LKHSRGCLYRCLSEIVRVRKKKYNSQLDREITRTGVPFFAYFSLFEQQLLNIQWVRLSKNRFVPKPVISHFKANFGRIFEVHSEAKFDNVNYLQNDLVCSTYTGMFSSHTIVGALFLYSVGYDSLTSTFSTDINVDAKGCHPADGRPRRLDTKRRPKSSALVPECENETPTMKLDSSPLFNRDIKSARRRN